jgi:hypothetical protein
MASPVFAVGARQQGDQQVTDSCHTPSVDRTATSTYSIKGLRMYDLRGPGSRGLTVLWMVWTSADSSELPRRVNAYTSGPSVDFRR